LICSRTSNHFKDLSAVEKNFKNKAVLVEKPLFEKIKKLKIKNNNVFVGYNLRFNPILNYIKNYIKNKEVFNIRCTCQSYLPFWRKNIDYKRSNSAKKKYGGGALLELSHEIDYIQWMLNDNLKLKFSSLRKISNLKIDTEDDVSIFGKVKKTDVFINLNFHSLQSQRIISVSGKHFVLKGDLINHNVKIIYKNKHTIKKFNHKINNSYLSQHFSILKNSYKNLCSYDQGMKLMTLIDKIRSYKNYEKK
jgi:predicted dehydrogenase